MKYYYKTTQTPNSLFDIHLKTLLSSELKVLLVIIRKTIGIADVNNKGNRLERAWISQKLFHICTNLSGRAISTAINSLIQKDLIIVTNQSGQFLKNKNARRGASRLYYSSNSLLERKDNKNIASDITCNNPVNKVHTIKQTITKQSCENSSQGITKLTDRERIFQIHRSKK